MALSAEEKKISNGITKKEVETSLQEIAEQYHYIDKQLTKLDLETKRFFLYSKAKKTG